MDWERMWRSERMTVCSTFISHVHEIHISISCSNSERIVVGLRGIPFHNLNHFAKVFSFIFTSVRRFFRSGRTGLVGFLCMWLGTGQDNDNGWCQQTTKWQVELQNNKILKFRFFFLVTRKVWLFLTKKWWCMWNCNIHKFQMLNLHYARHRTDMVTSWTADCEMLVCCDCDATHCESVCIDIEFHKLFQRKHSIMSHLIHSLTESVSSDALSPTTSLSIAIIYVIHYYYIIHSHVHMNRTETNA